MGCPVACLTRQNQDPELGQETLENPRPDPESKAGALTPQGMKQLEPRSPRQPRLCASLKGKFTQPAGFAPPPAPPPPPGLCPAGSSPPFGVRCSEASQALRSQTRVLPLGGLAADPSSAGAPATTPRGDAWGHSEGRGPSPAHRGCPACRHPRPSWIDKRGAGGD